MEEHYCELRPGGERCENVARFRVQDMLIDPSSDRVWWACAPCFDVCMGLDGVWREV